MDAVPSGAKQSRTRWLGGGQPSELLIGALTLCAVLVLHALPRVVLGQGSIIDIYDNLDSTFTEYALLGRGGRMFDDHALIPELLGGVPRAVLPSGAKFSAVLFALLPPFSAYVVLELVVRAVAFTGMWALLRSHLAQKLDTVPLLAIAATFAVLPFTTIHGVSVAGQPWCFWALISLWKDDRPRGLPLLVLVLVGLDAWLMLTGLFVTADAIVAMAIAACIWRRLPVGGLYGIATLIAAFVVSDWPFVKSIFSPGYVPHRALWMAEGSTLIRSTRQVFADGLDTFLFGQAHATSSHTLILAFLVLTLIAACVRREYRVARWMLIIVGIGAFNAWTRDATSWAGLRSLWDAVPMTRMIHLRFYWSSPTLWFAALGIMASVWMGRWGLPRLAGFALLANALWVVVVPPHGIQSELRANYRLLWSLLRGKPPPTNPSYREFVSHDLFAEVEREIGLPQSAYRVVSVGIHPSVSLLNGFYTADGYLNNYPLSYKVRFRKLIAGQLAQDEVLRHYFDDWGSRAYVFTDAASRGLMDRRQTPRHLTLDKLELDREALTDLGISYVFSAMELRGTAASGALRFEKMFEDPGAAWQVYLYRVVP